MSTQLLLTKQYFHLGFNTKIEELAHIPVKLKRKNLFMGCINGLEIYLQSHRHTLRMQILGTGGGAAITQMK